MDGIIQGLLALMKPMGLLALLGGTLLGLVGGATPGISGLMLVVVLLPLTYGMTPTVAFVLLCSIYMTAVFSGSISAILFRVPGAPEAVATTLDGYPMSQQGKTGEALGLAISSSAIGGIIGGIIMLVMSPLLAQFALRFAAPEYFALALMGISLVAALSEGKRVKGVIGACIGLLITTVGIDMITGVPRYTLNSPLLMAGIDFIPVLLGLFALSEVFRKSQEKEQMKLGDTSKVKARLPKLSYMMNFKGLIMRSSLLGTFIGVLPGVGATTAAMLSYAQAVSTSKHPEKFGTGIPEGIIASEAANNAAANGAMVPLVALGIPGSATTAVLLGGFILHGLQPGPLLMRTSPDVVYSMFIALILVCFLILVISNGFIKYFAKLMSVSYAYLGTIIIMLSLIGTFATRNSMVDLWTIVIAGIIGYFLDKLNFPVAPIILGVVLGPMTEENLRRSLVMSGGDFSIFITRPISAVLLIATVIGVVAPILLKQYRLKRIRDLKKKSAEIVNVDLGSKDQK